MECKMVEGIAKMLEKYGAIKCPKCGTAEAYILGSKLMPFACYRFYLDHSQDYITCLGCGMPLSDRWAVKAVYAKIQRESRPLYRLKKWFLGLRWVNNYLWRRQQVSIDYFRKFTDTTHRDEDGNLEQDETTWCYMWDAGWPCQNTALFPDYPSIRRLA
jgi:ribosomal protein S27E